MTTEYAYDPELPFVVEIQGNVLCARFKYEVAAVDYILNGGQGTVIDTTPKPKIPADAEFVFVEDGDQSVFAKREGVIDGEMMWLTDADYITEKQLLEDYICDAQVTVLVPKETS